LRDGISGTWKVLVRRELEDDVVGLVVHPHDNVELSAQVNRSVTVEDEGRAKLEDAAIFVSEPYKS
jgi:hypothetical protein